MDVQRLAIAASWGALAGGALQFLIQMPWVLKLERELKLNWDTKSVHVRSALGNAGPAIMGRGVVQLSGWMDMWIASFLPGAVAILSYAQTFYLLPISLFGMAVAAAELPELSREGEADLERLRSRLSAGVQRIALLVVPSTIAYVLLGDVIVAALYQRGSFTRADTVIVAATLGFYSIGLLAATATRLLSSAFFALRDTRTPARIAIARVIIAGVIGGGATLLIRTRYPEYLRYGAIPLAAAAGLAAWYEWFMLRNRLARRLGHVPAGRRAILRMIAAAVVAGVLARILYVSLPDWEPLIQAMIVLPPFGILYFVVANLLGVKEAALSKVLRVLKR